MSRLFLLLMILSACCLNVFAQKKDILDIAESNPLKSQIQNSDGTFRTPKYGDYELEKAVSELKNYSRPWTVEKVSKWYGKAKNEKVRANLLRVLAASKSSKAAVILGNALSDNSLDVRSSAVYGLMDYFLGYVFGGGTEEHFIGVENWWKQNKERLMKEAEIELD